MRSCAIIHPLHLELETARSNNDHEDLHKNRICRFLSRYYAIGSSETDPRHSTISAGCSVCGRDHDLVSASALHHLLEGPRSVQRIANPCRPSAEGLHGKECRKVWHLGCSVGQAFATDGQSVSRRQGVTLAPCEVLS